MGRYFQKLRLQPLKLEDIEIPVLLRDPVSLCDLLQFAVGDEAAGFPQPWVFLVFHLKGKRLPRALDDDIDFLLGRRIAPVRNGRHVPVIVRVEMPQDGGLHDDAHFLRIGENLFTTQQDGITQGCVHRDGNGDPPSRAALERRLSELKGKLNQPPKDSCNSSIPSSKDRKKSEPAKRSPKGIRRAGIGRKGGGRPLDSNPD